MVYQTHIEKAVKESFTDYAAGKCDNPLHIFKLEQVIEAVGDSVFSNLLKNTANKRMIQAFDLASGSWSTLVNKPFGNRPDFKKNTLIRIEEMARLPIVSKREKVTMDTVGEESGEYRVRSYEKGYQFTREDIVNDDLGAFMKFPQSQGRAAARTIDKYVYDFINDNASAGIDGQILFSNSSAHDNIATTSPLSTTNLEVVQNLLTAQTEKKTGDKLALRPSFLIVPTSLELLANRIVRSTKLQGTTNNDMNPFDSLQVIVSPWLTDTGVVSTADWYLAASPSMTETIQLDFLKGRSTPETLHQIPDSKDGYDFINRTRAFKTRYEFGGMLADYRWIAKGDAV